MARPRSVRALPALAAALLAAVLPATPAQGAPVPVVVTADGGVEVSALVERPDGRLVVRTARADGVREARAAAARWATGHRVLAADVSVPVQAASGPTRDPLQADQWGLTAVRAEAAWARGSAAGQVVAVLDTGVDLRHPDLAPVLVPGYDHVDRDTVPQDLNGHGTHVAGIAAAVAGNGVGGAGLAWRASLMPVRVLDAEGRGSSSTVAAGLVRAVDEGATVVNLSLGGPVTDEVLASAVRYALDRGVVVVAAAGNEGTGSPRYPAAQAGVIGVGAVDEAGVRPAWSNTGAHLAVVGPGVRVLATTPAGGHGLRTGTSMASPFVAAAAALARAAAPALTPAEVRDAVMATAVDLGPDGADPQYGAGRLDADALLARVLGQPVEPPPSGPPAQQPSPAPTPDPAPAPDPAPEPTTQPSTQPATQPTTQPSPGPSPEPTGVRDLSQACPAGRVPATPFTDVADDVHRRAVECVVWWRVAQGRTPTTYAPSATVTRGQMATFVAGAVLRSGGTLPPAQPGTFRDVEGSVHADAIGRLATAGVVRGVAPGTYAPDRPVTRDQMATFLVRAAELREGRALPAPSSPPFADVAGNVHEGAIGQAVRAGFTAGTADGRYRPAEPVTRGQMASFVARVLDRLVAERFTAPPG